MLLIKVIGARIEAKAGCAVLNPVGTPFGILIFRDRAPFSLWIASTTGSRMADVNGSEKSILEF